ncbi:MAG: four-carbon acid sugar kinase family protein [Caulobacteraceae bacterium]
MGPRIVILADDLSGAADCAMACRRAGMNSQVRLDPEARGAPPEALALDLDSRALPPAEALARTRGAKGSVGKGVHFRKIDSTLRGHVALDVAATLELAGAGAFALVCPAYPATGRAMRDGVIHVNGQPLAETEIWRLGGRGSTDLKALLGEAGLSPAALGLGAVRGPDLGACIEAARSGGARAVVCDAETEDDLAALVTAALPLAGVVWVGSGGLTIPLAEALSPAAAAAPDVVIRRAGPTLMAVGSASSVSREQLAVLSEDPRVLTLTVTPRVLLEGPEGSGWRPASRALVAAVGKPGRDTVAIAIDPAAPIDPGAGPALAAGLGALAGRQLGRFGALAATGGETARALLAAAGVRCLDIRRELEPGVVLSQAGGLPVVTKAGAFGHADSLVRAVEALRALPLA